MENSNQTFNAESFRKYWDFLADRISYVFKNGLVRFEMPYPIPTGSLNQGSHLSVSVIKAIENALLPYPTSELDVVLPAGSCLGVPIDFTAKTDNPNQQPETYWLLTYSDSKRFIQHNHPIWQFFDEVMICRYPNFKRGSIPRLGHRHSDLQQTFVDNHTASTLFPQLRYEVYGKPGIPKENRDYRLVKKDFMFIDHEAAIKEVIQTYLNNGGSFPSRYTQEDGSLRCDVFMAGGEYQLKQLNMFGENLPKALQPIQLEPIDTRTVTPSTEIEERDLFWKGFYSFNLFIQLVPATQSVEHVYNSFAVSPIAFGARLVAGFERVTEFTLPINHLGKATTLTVTVKNTAMSGGYKASVEHVDVVVYPRDVDYDNSFISWYAGTENPLLQPLIRKGVTLPVMDGRTDQSAEETRLYEGAVTRKLYSVQTTQRLMGKDQEYRLKFLPLKGLLD